jgi:hypothetical protein
LVVAPRRRRLLDLGEDRLPVERSPEERIEVGQRVETPMGSQGVLPLVEADGAAAAAVGRDPRLEDGGLGVDDESVEVEDDGGDAGGQGTRPQPRAAAI